jgi:hypothetical protein
VDVLALIEGLQLNQTVMQTKMQEAHDTMKREMQGEIDKLQLQLANAEERVKVIEDDTPETPKKHTFPVTVVPKADRDGTGADWFPVGLLPGDETLTFSVGVEGMGR